MNQNKWFIKQGSSLMMLSLLLATVSFLKEAVFANYFGTTEKADAYMIAIQVPEILFAIVWEAINAIIIPLYSQAYYRKGEKEASYFYRNFLTIINLGIICFIFFAEFSATFFIKIFAPGLSISATETAIGLFRWIVPMLCFEGIIRINTGILNVHKQFLVPKILANVRNIVYMLYIVVFFSKFGIYSAAYGILSGMIAEAIIFILFTKRYENYSFEFNLKDPYLKKSGKMIIPLVIGIGAGEINKIVDKIVASFLSSGTISGLSYGAKLSAVFRSIIFDNIMVLLYPSYSELAAKRKNRELIALYQKTINISIILCLPIVVCGGLLSKEIVAVAFGRGAFDEESVALTSTLFLWYLISDTFVTIRMASTKLFSALCDQQTVMKNSLIGISLNIVLDVLLAKFFGAVGLAIATAISTAIIAILLFKDVNHKIGKVSYIKTLTTLLRSMIGAVLMGGAIICIKIFLMNFWDFAELNIVQQIVFVGGSSLVGILIYGIFMVMAKVPEVLELTKYIRRRSGDTNSEIK